MKHIRLCMYTANWHNFTFLIPHPNPPPLGEGVYEKRRLCQFAVYLLVCVFFHTGIYAQEPMLPTGQVPVGAGLPVPFTPEGARPLAPPSGSAQMGVVAPASLYFAAGTISPDGKNLYVSFDRYLIHYALPELKLIQKVDIGLPVVPVTPSIFLSPDSNWIYIIQNGTIFQIEKISFKIKSSEKLHP